MIKLLTQIFRIIVALVFIFSGFVKLIDPVGTQIKMLEYFEVLHLDFLSPWAMPISVFLILAEFGLGIFLLFGLYPKFTARALLWLTLFFLFLTWYSAYFNKVTDCGCFGDAIKLTPWETFYKNVVLMAMILWLNLFYSYIRPFPSKKTASALSHIILTVAFILIIYTLYHLPLIDFRPYAIGKNIPEGMKIPDDAPQAEFKDTWYYKINGETKEFTTEEEPWNIPGAEFVDRKTIVIQEGYVPPIHDFSIENEEGDITDEVLDAREIYLIISSNPQAVSPEAKEKVNRFARELKKKNKKIIGLFSQTDDVEGEYEFPVYLTDQTTLKTMIRSNPGMIKLEKGTVKEKKAWRDL